MAVCVFFLQNDLQWTSYPNTHTVSVGGGGPAFWSLLQDLLQAHDWFGFHGPSRWVFIVTPCPLLSFLGHPSGANIYSASWKLVRPAHVWLHLTLQSRCVSATSVPVLHPEELLGSELVTQLLQLMMSCVMQARVTPSDLYLMGCRELRPLALVTICQENKLNITRLESWSQENWPF